MITQQMFDNSPENIDTWINDTDDTFIVNCHMAHGEGISHRTRPQGARYTFPPHSETPVPKLFRAAIHQYVCNHPECRESPGSKMCTKDHDTCVIVGGQAPMLRRKDRPNIPLTQALDMSLVEVKEMDMSGRPSFRLRNPVDITASAPVEQPAVAPLATARPSRAPRARKPRGEAQAAAGGEGSQKE